MPALIAEVCKDRDMTPSVVQRWTSIIENGRTDELDALLADDAVFFSPAVFTPQEGRQQTLMYLEAAAKVFGDTDFHYVEQWYNDQSAILEFAATIDGIYVNGIDMIHWNDDEQIVSFKVMLRPLKALQTIIPAMAELLQHFTAGDGPLHPASPRLRPPL
jgi:ketosteroid isomerase-like protein